MGANFNINRGMENKKTSKIVIPIIILISLAFLIVFVFLAFNGKHNKMPGFETNIPKDSTKVIKETNGIKIEHMKGDIIKDSATKNVYVH